jgi:hypothetical protein
MGLMMQQAVLQSLLPGLTVAAIGRWPAIPVPAATLPRVRDRLTALIQGPLGLPLGLDSPRVRTAIADSVPAARLFWIDPEFAGLADHAAGLLPATRLTAADLPAPHGLLAWGQPVGPRGDLIAASWTTTPDGVQIVGYRSVGAGLPAGELQQLRETIGWLGPRRYTRLSAAEPLDASSPAAVLVATWLLIGQRMTETVPANVDKTIRRAYQRSGRPVPQVQLVRIRGTAATRLTRRDDRPGPVSGRQQSPHEYRWWVKAHWRQQPYGPGRALRRPLLVLPQLRGPDDKPIKASTVVRTLTSAPPRPTRADTDEGAGD